MVEGSSKNPTHQELDEEITYGPVNIKQAHEYAVILEKIIEDSRECLLAGQNDALQTMIQEMKKHMTKTWNDMTTADADIIITSILHPKGTSLWDYIVEEGVTTSDPEADIPTGLEVTRSLQQQQNEKEIMELYISFFDHMSEAMGHISAAMASLSSITKCTNHKTFKMILQASGQPLVQLNIPVKILDPVLDKPQEKWETKGLEQILPNDKNTRLQKEPKNSPTRLLAVAVYYKLRRRFLNEGTQTEAVNKFNVNGKA